MNIYLLTQEQNRNYSTYDSLVVVAKSEEEARNIHPNGQDQWGKSRAWCHSPSDVTVKLLGRALHGVEQGIVLSSFIAG